MKLFVLVFTFLLACSCIQVRDARAQFFASLDPSQYATKSEVSAIDAKIPTPASIIPPMDTATGTPGAITNQFQRPDAARPRVTRSKVVMLNGSGVGSFDYSANALLNVSASCPADPTTCPVVQVTPLYTTASGAPKCWATAPATATSAPVKCVVENTALINLSIVTVGLTLNGSQALYVNVLVLPPSQ